MSNPIEIHLSAKMFALKLTTDSEGDFLDNFSFLTFRFEVAIQSSGVTY